jgi:hypothetical protein
MQDPKPGQTNECGDEDIKDERQKYQSCLRNVQSQTHGKADTSLS